MPNLLQYDFIQILTKHIYIDPEILGLDANLWFWQVHNSTDNSVKWKDVAT